MAQLRLLALGIGGFAYVHKQPLPAAEMSLAMPGFIGAL